MSRLKQVRADLTALQGVDLSKVPNQKIRIGKPNNTAFNSLATIGSKAAIRTSALTTTTGEWATIPLDFESGGLSVAIKKHAASTSSTTETVAVTGSGFINVGFGPTVGFGPYIQKNPGEFGITGFAGVGFSTSLGVSGAIDLIFLDGPISLMDGLGFMVVVDVGVGKVVFAGMGILVSSTFSIIGVVFEFGGGLSAAPPVSIEATVTSGGHIKLI